jgi:hypothetical protein
MSKSEKALARVAELEYEVESLRTTLRKIKTYHAAVQLQNRNRERSALIANLRARIRVAADNAWTDDL